MMVMIMIRSQPSSSLASLESFFICPGVNPTNTIATSASFASLTASENPDVSKQLVDPSGSSPSLPTQPGVYY